MQKKRSHIVDYLVYLVARSVVCIVQIMSWPVALELARAFAWLFYRIDRKHRLIATENVRLAFPHLDQVSVDRIVRDSYTHLTTMLVEMIRIPRVLRPGNLYTDHMVHANPHDMDLVRQCIAIGRPHLILTGHFGNWEIMSYASGLAGFRGAIVARRLDNPYLDRFLADFRRKTGLELLDKNADYARILATLKAGLGLGMVGDQDAGTRGLFVNFFGRPASTFKSIALLCLEYNAPIFVFGTARIGTPMRYRAYLEDVIYPEEYANHPNATRAITERYTQGLERLIRRHPEQYFWLHRRWKHQPKAKKAAA